MMRTTLEIDDDLLAAAKELARRENISAGQMVSRLLRDILTRSATTSGPAVAGFRPFAANGQVTSNDQVNALRESEGV